MNKRRVFWSVCLTYAVLFFSCEVGLGPETDLQGPVITIESHSNMDYVPRECELRGSWYDESGISRILVSLPETGETVGKARIQGKEWSIWLTLPEGEQTVRVTGYDVWNNSSDQSMDQITLLVDATPPFLEGLSLERGPGYTVPLKSREELQGYDPEDIQFLDYFQNGTFRIKGEIRENFTVHDVTLHLLDEQGREVLTKPVDDDAPPLSPVFTLSASDFEGTGYVSGRAYFRVTVSSTDIGGNENTDQGGWFCYYPEADLPRIIQGDAREGVITVGQGAEVPFSFVDDDGLDLIYVGVLSQSAWESIQGETDGEKLATLEEDDDMREALLGPALQGNGARSYNHTLSAPQDAGSYVLVALVRDTKPYDDPPVWSGAAYRLTVTDPDQPLGVITSPEENTFPAVDPAGRWVLQGACIDNSAVEEARLAWVPEGLPGGAEAHLEETRQLLSSVSVGPGDKVVDDAGMVVWGLSLSGPEEITIGGRTYKRYPFAQEVDVLQDFMYEGVLENTTKLFLLYVKDDSGNEAYTAFRLVGDTSLPVIGISQPEEDYQLYTSDEELTLSFSASKENGIPIHTLALYEVTSGDPVLLTTGSTSPLSYTFSPPLEEGLRSFRFVATDVFGNICEEERTVRITSRPVLQYIGTPLADGVYKAGDELLFEAVFSSPVEVSGTPRLKLYYDATLDSPDAYATYHSGAGSSTLLFSFTVPSGVQVDKLYTAYEEPFDLSGGSIVGAEGGEVEIPLLEEQDTLQGRSSIGCDGIAPRATGLTGSGTYRAAQTVELSLSVEDDVLVSGDVRLVCAAGADTIEGQFDRVENGDLIFVYLVEDGINAASLSYTVATLVNDPSRITDAAGNPLDLSSLTDGTLPITIDTTSPDPPVITLGEGIYNTPQTLTIEGIEQGAVVEYSLDGGLSWFQYDQDNPPQITGDGVYQVCARQIDEAGNVSEVSPVKEIGIDTGAPQVVEVACVNPDGVYGAGATLTFKVVFSEKVRTTGGDAALELNNAYTAGVEEDPDGAYVLYFAFTVPDGAFLNPVEATRLTLSHVEDLCGNLAPPVLEGDTLPDLGRPNLRVDAVPPALQSTSPTEGGILTGGNLTLTFDEPVFKESGAVVVRRHQGWLIPPVMSEEEFTAVYYASALTSEDRQVLMETDDQGAPLLDQTGQPVGPYRKLTHGLLQEGGEYVPDLSTKYVLAFERGLADEQIRTVLEKAGYHIFLDVNVTSSRIQIQGEVVTISLPEGIPPGIQWDLVIDAGAFRDSAGNPSPEITCSFWSDGVSPPIIRIDRYSHGEGAREPEATPAGDGLTGTITGYRDVGPGDTTTEPTGFVRVRIDSQTPGVTIRYLVTDDPQVPGEPSTVYGFTHASYTDFLAAGKPLTPGTSQAANEDDPQRIYIKAVAEHPQLGSSYGYAGAFKTVVVLVDPQGGSAPVQIQGTEEAGAPPTTPGFPLRDADPDPRYSKYMYQFGNNDWVWISWEIVTSWMQTSYRSNWQQNYNPGDYGALTYRENQPYW
ncbi:hypothetical protein [Spirochaeta thermophila]|uniref:SbsA Ig-like domain-containing protein n=1 Tax=Winmispira thermophila (strain ATCC 49972 / DSM 6192 / RI 19.B1) TaxID=665571 RepID=E0RNE8_WINT6|nr:hypothetical protein [Spirochaeta thermophila]ADN01148.1 hypothetical protein STHERM_c01720 [Spirochaeta thermophila DSM 6192]